MSTKIGKVEHVLELALKILEQHPEGLRYSELSSKILEADNTIKQGTINGSLNIFDSKCSDKVYKPSRGVYRLLSFTPPPNPDPSDGAQIEPETTSIREEDFYKPFAVWLQNEIEDVTLAVEIGGNLFKDKWGTPDVIGKKESRRSDIIKGPTEIVSAEIKISTQQLVTAFGQACAYRLFSHKVYLVVPNQSQTEEISRLDSLCQIFGIGLVTFDANSIANPDFRIMVRPVRYEPDLYYTNKYISLIEDELFPKGG